MAKKEWKLTVNTEYKKHWINKNEDEKEIMITPSNFKYPSDSWQAHYIEPDDSSYRLSTWKTKTFKNKKNALKFALLYIRGN